MKVTSVADTTKSASATVNVATAGSSTLLLGDQSVESQVDGSLPLGNAEAFQTKAMASGSLQSLALYLDPTSTVSQVVAGLYADAAGHPGNLLNQGINTQVVSGAWNSISLPATNVVAGTPVLDRDHGNEQRDPGFPRGRWRNLRQRNQLSDVTDYAACDLDHRQRIFHLPRLCFWRWRQSRLLR